MYAGWLSVSVIFYCLGGYAWAAERPVKFWNIAQQIQVRDVKKYNRAVAKLWILFAALWDLMGIPLLAGQNSSWIVISILGAVAWSIALMVVYIRIEKKYRIF